MKKKIGIIYLIVFCIIIALHQYEVVYGVNDNISNDIFFSEKELPKIELDNDKKEDKTENSNNNEKKQNKKTYIVKKNAIVIMIFALVLVFVFFVIIIKRRKLNRKKYYKQKVYKNKKDKRNIYEPHLKFDKEENRAVFVYLQDISNKNIIFQTVMLKQINIGRAYDNDICISYDKSISSHHCSLIRDGSTIILRDNTSKNGTYYDGIRIISENTIIPGKILAIGNQQFRLEFSIK